jgi:hypothetical protein
MELNVPPWAFSVEGEVKSPGGDPDVLFNGIFDEELIVVMAYIPYPTQGKDGNEYQTGMFDLMIIYKMKKHTSEICLLIFFLQQMIVGQKNPLKWQKVLLRCLGPFGMVSSRKRSL